MKPTLDAVSKTMAVPMDDNQRKMERGEAALLFRNSGHMEVIVSQSDKDDVPGRIPPRVFAIVLSDIISREDGVWPQLWDMAFKATSARLMKEKMDAAGVSSN